VPPISRPPPVDGVSSPEGMGRWLEALSGKRLPGVVRQSFTTPVYIDGDGMGAPAKDVSLEGPPPPSPPADTQQRKTPSHYQ
jgi:hypothetical protein